MTTAGSFIGVHFGANEHLQQHNNINHQHHQQQHRGSVGGGARATASEAVVVQPTASGPSPTSLPTANGAHSHSNAGSEHSGSSAAIGTATNRTGSGNSSVIVERESSSTVCNSAVVVSSNSSNNGKLIVPGVNGQTQQQPNLRDGVAARKMVAATAAEEIVVVYEKNTVLGGGLDATGGGVVGGGGIGAIGDAGEELKYGPGIVSRLRCRYLSLALRQSVTKQRPSLNSMRRATSLNNLLDEESEDLSEREQSIGSEGTGGGVGHQQKKYQSQNYHHHHHQQQQQPQREHYSNGNGNNHNHNHNHHQQQQQQQQLHPTVVLQPPYQKQQHHFAPKQQPWIQQQQQQHKEDDQQQQGGGAVKTAPFLRGVQNSYTRASRQVEKKNEYNRYTKHHRGASGADAVLLKRARSVEALVRYDHKAWERDGANPVAPPAIATAPAPAALAVSSSAEVGSNVIILDEIAQATTTTATTTATAATVPAGTEVHGTTNGISSSVSPTAMLMNGKGTAGGAGSASELPLLVSDCVTIEEKIINGREKGDPKPKRLTSIIDADERPPPDVVKQTMKIFEANANRRGGRGVPGTNNAGNEVATKVASYRSIIISGSATAGATTAAAAVSSAVGPGDKPPITHPKPPLSPKKPNIKPRTASPKQQHHQATSAKPPPTPKSLEAVNNLKNAPGGGTTVKNNNKPPPLVVGGTIESTPPSPPARSKHTTAAAAVNGGGVGIVLAKNMQSINGGGNGGDDGNATATQPDPTDAKPNALKNGSTVRDHHNYENGTTQTTPLTKTSSTATLPPGSDGGHQHKHTGNIAQEATAPTAAVLASSSPSGICDSPSIQQLASKLGSLHLATSTPTGAANGSISSVHDRRNLEYVTSDEEEEDDDDDDDVDGERRNTTSYTVNPDSSESEDARDIPGAAAGSENDADDDEAEEEEEEDTDGGQRSVRKISRTAMENIARAGTTTQFRFNGAVKSYLPGSGAVGGGSVAAHSTKPPAPPIPKSRESLAGKANGASSAVPIEVNGRLPPEGASVTSPNSVINSGGNNSNNSSAVVGSSAVQVVASSVGAESGGSATSVAPSLTRREIEKNQINREKSGEPAGPASSGPNSINGTGAAPAIAGPGTTTGNGGASGVLVASANNPNNGGASGGVKQATASNSISAVSVDSTTSFVAKWGTSGGGGAGVTVAAAGQSPLAGLVPVRKKVKPPPNHQQDGTNTMVFNFSDRKDVPDYIENDGVIIRPRPRELPKSTI
uniref:Uncharacterized protein n=1 Tax=Anopheles minimus TaxID=112268 RepID=A0A182VQV6_9DIPT